MASEFRLAHFFKPISSLFGADRLNDPENLGKVLWFDKGDSLGEGRPAEAGRHP
jgi:hypothetical protein